MLSALGGAPLQMGHMRINVIALRASRTANTAPSHSTGQACG